MTERDDDIVELLRGIDAPRSLPGELVTRIELAASDRPRPMPEDLRARLEASLLDSAMPPVVRRRLVTSLTARASVFPRVAAVAAAVLLLVGAVVATTRDEGADRVDVAGPRPSPSTTEPARPTSGGAPTVAGSTGAAAGGSAATATPPPFTEPAPSDGAATSDSSEPQADAGAVASPAEAASPIRVRVLGAATPVAAGFDAYVAVVNAAGGVHGRPIEVVDDPAGAVVSVNVGLAPAGPVDGVLFETVHVDDARLRGRVTSLASPLEAQARLAARHAFPDDGTGSRAAVYVHPATPWVDHVADAFADELRARDVTVVRVPFDAAAPAIVDADAAFLSLPTTSVGAWLDAARGSPAPPLGTWGVASAWDDAFAEAAAGAALHVLAPYAPASDEEVERLGRPLSAERVHGWVTAKALAHLLFLNGGATIGDADLDRLAGWDPGWAPPFAVRDGTRARTPEAVRLEVTGGAFRRAGDFERAGS